MNQVGADLRAIILRNDSHLPNREGDTKPNDVSLTGASKKIHPLWVGIFIWTLLVVARGNTPPDRARAELGHGAWRVTAEGKKVDWRVCWMALWHVLLPL